MTPAAAPRIDTADVVATRRLISSFSELPSQDAELTAADANGDTLVDHCRHCQFSEIRLKLHRPGSPILVSTSSPLRTAPIRGLAATRPLRISTRWSSATSLLLLSNDARMAHHQREARLTAPSADEVPVTIAAVALPGIAAINRRGNIIAAVTTSAIDSEQKGW